MRREGFGHESLSIFHKFKILSVLDPSSVLDPAQQAHFRFSKPDPIKTNKNAGKKPAFLFVRREGLMILTVTKLVPR
ncbi:MAG TPA: hypothetical protein VJH21_00405 [Candidatus Paceibacterota bacterium]